MVAGLRWLMSQKLLRTMAILIGLLNVTLTAALSVLVLLAKDRLHVGSVGYGALFTCMAIGGLLGSVIGDRLIKLVTATWTIRIGLIIEAALHLILATSTSAWLVGVGFLTFGVHGALWTDRIQLAPAAADAERGDGPGLQRLPLRRGRRQLHRRAARWRARVRRTG